MIKVDWRLELIDDSWWLFIEIPLQTDRQIDKQMDDWRNGQHWVWSCFCDWKWHLALDLSLVCLVIFLSVATFMEPILKKYEWYTRFWFLFISSIHAILSICMDSKNIQWCYVKLVLILGLVTPGIGWVKNSVYSKIQSFPGRLNVWLKSDIIYYITVSVQIQFSQSSTWIWAFLVST